MNKKELVKAVIEFLIEMRQQGAERVHFGALATEDDEITLGNLIDQVIKKERHGN